MNNPQLAIIIVNHNTKKLTQNCIESIFENTYAPNYHIVVVDNSSDPKQRFNHYLSSMVTVINVKNKGFGHACNVGVLAVDAPFYLLLNSDTLVHKGAIDKCLAFMENHPSAGAVGGKTILEDGSFDHNCKRGLPTPAASLFYMTGIDRIFKNSPTFARYHATYLSPNARHQVEVLSGAFMMIRQEAWEKINGFDVRFFLYGEDIDLCMRIASAGWKLFYIPNAVVTHLKGQSGLHLKNPPVIKYFYRSMLLFYHKHFEHIYPLPVTVLVYLAVTAKMSIALAKANHLSRI